MQCSDWDGGERKGERKRLYATLCLPSFHSLPIFRSSCLPPSLPSSPPSPLSSPCSVPLSELVDISSIPLPKASKLKALTEASAAAAGGKDGKGVALKGVDWSEEGDHDPIALHDYFVQKVGERVYEALMREFQLTPEEFERPASYNDPELSDAAPEYELLARREQQQQQQQQGAGEAQSKRASLSSSSSRSSRNSGEHRPQLQQAAMEAEEGITSTASLTSRDGAAAAAAVVEAHSSSPAATPAPTPAAVADSQALRSIAAAASSPAPFTAQAAAAPSEPASAPTPRHIAVDASGNPILEVVAPSIPLETPPQPGMVRRRRSGMPSEPNAPLLPRPASLAPTIDLSLDRTVTSSGSSSGSAGTTAFSSSALASPSKAAALPLTEHVTSSAPSSASTTAEEVQATEQQLLAAEQELLHLQSQHLASATASLATAGDGPVTPAVGVPEHEAAAAAAVLPVVASSSPSSPSTSMAPASAQQPAAAQQQEEGKQLVALGAELAWQQRSERAAGELGAEAEGMTPLERRRLEAEQRAQLAAEWDSPQAYSKRVMARMLKQKLLLLQDPLQQSLLASTEDSGKRRKRQVEGHKPGFMDTLLAVQKLQEGAAQQRQQREKKKRRQQAAEKEGAAGAGGVASHSSGSGAESSVSSTTSTSPSRARDDAPSSEDAGNSTSDSSALLSDGSMSSGQDRRELGADSSSTALTTTSSTTTSSSSSSALSSSPAVAAAAAARQAQRQKEALAQLRSLTGRPDSAGSSKLQALSTLSSGLFSGAAWLPSGDYPAETGARRQRMLQEAELIYYQELPRLGLQPDLFTLNTMLGAYCYSGRGREAYAFLRSEFKRAGQEPDVHSYRALLRLHVELEKDTGKAEAVLTTMKEAGLQPDKDCYGLLVHAYAREYRIKEAIEVLREMKAAGQSCSEHYAFLLRQRCKELGIFHAEVPAHPVGWQFTPEIMAKRRAYGRVINKTVQQVLRQPIKKGMR